MNNYVKCLVAHRKCRNAQIHTTLYKYANKKKLNNIVKNLFRISSFFWSLAVSDKAFSRREFSCKFLKVFFVFSYSGADFQRPICVKQVI